MKYINREYGFQGRPPYFMDFYEETYKSFALAGSSYPIHPIVGAGLDHGVPNGALLVGNLGTMWGIKVSYIKNGKWISDQDFVEEIGRLYTVSANGKFAYFAHGDLTVTCVNYDERSIVISISAMATTKLRVTYYPKAPSEGVYKAGENSIRGSAPAYAVIKGKTTVSEEGCMMKGRFDVISDDKKEYFRASCTQKPAAILPGDGNAVVYEYDLTNNVNSRLMIYATVGTRKILDAESPTDEEIIAGISNAEIEYTSDKIAGSGALGGCTASALDATMWFRTYNPYFLGMTYFPERKIDEYYSYDGLKLNIGLIAGSILGDVKACEHSVAYAAEDKLLSVLTTWIVFSRRRNLVLLREMYPVYKTVFKPTSDLTVANWKKKTEVAYRMNGSPLKETFRHENMYSLDMSCINLLINDLMERMAHLVGTRSEVEAYREARIALKQKINDTLYNDGLGIYMNRYVDGDFANSFGITSFYPLVAGAVDDPERLRRTVACLTNPKKFWGDCIVPTISRDHYEYGVKYKDVTNGDMKPAYREYRGMIVPYMNYLVYMGLVRYGVHITSEYATKCVKLFKKFYGDNHETYEAYLPTSKEGIGNPHSIDGALLAMTGVCELIDVEYFRNDLSPAIRFGTLQKGENSVANVVIFGKRYTVKVTDTVTYLTVDGEQSFYAEGGKCAVRQFSEGEDECEFLITSDSNIMITMNYPILTRSDTVTKLVFAVEKGKNKVTIRGGALSVQPL